MAAFPHAGFFAFCSRAGAARMQFPGISPDEMPVQVEGKIAWTYSYCVIKLDVHLLAIFPSAARTAIKTARQPLG
ncbi:hypothetical protein, partial [Azotobacter chroococcum]